MFYYNEPSLTFQILLVIAAVIPALVLMFLVYRSDRLEKESRHLLFVLARAGVFATLIAMVLERLGERLLVWAIDSEVLFNLLLYFVVVAVSEEGAKYFLMKRRTWKNPEFNCLYDGVVYAVFVSLGFALWENISYVLIFGLGTALIRAFTAIPGHACFGVFMGVFYGLAKQAENMGDAAESKKYRSLALAAPIVLHGAYDYIATMDADWGAAVFFAFIGVMFCVAFILMRRMSRRDQYIR
ncbi:MAG: PrsW family intramembrane metalloprotease [Lachnospiraceae bacterium]|nr:PrsW family intramembrane metalloprotease [Lachnospiraceae bacterium]